MKKIYCFIALLAAVFSMSACSDDTEPVEGAKPTALQINESFNDTSWVAVNSSRVLTYALTFSSDGTVKFSIGPSYMTDSKYTWSARSVSGMWSVDLANSKSYVHQVNLDTVTPNYTDGSTKVVLTPVLAKAPSPNNGGNLIFRLRKSSYSGDSVTETEESMTMMLVESE